MADTPGALLERVRKLLAKAEAEGVTPAEAEALTAKATELMARYGIDRALLAAARPDTDRQASRIIDVYNPWSQVKAHLLGGLASAIRCACVQLPRDRHRRPYPRVRLRIRPGAGRDPLHLAADPDGARPDRRAGAGNVRSVRAYRRSWLLGYTSAVVTRVREAEQRAAATQRTSR